MTMTTDNAILQEDLDVFQEIMNIAFGKASADLAEIVDIYVNLSVPFVKLLKTAELPDYVKDEIKDYAEISTVRQEFWGGLKGSALLVFPAGAGKELISLLIGDQGDTRSSDPMDELEKGTLMEVGNILIGACVGKIAQLLNDGLAYSPPIVRTGGTADHVMPKIPPDSYDSTIALRTTFAFEKKNVVGFLFVITSHESMRWLKKALTGFMEQFG